LQSVEKRRKNFANHAGPGALLPSGARKGVELVSRLNTFHRRVDFRRGQRLGPDDHVVRWAKSTSIRSLDWKTYCALPEFITVRETRIRVRQPGFGTKSIVLVTTLLDSEQTTKEDLATLYRARWNNEVDLRAIKSTMQMRELRCKTPEQVAPSPRSNRCHRDPPGRRPHQSVRAATDKTEAKQFRLPNQASRRDETQNGGRSYQELSAIRPPHRSRI
jgi:hypothetical protein